MFSPLPFLSCSLSFYLIGLAEWGAMFVLWGGGCCRVHVRWWRHVRCQGALGSLELPGMLANCREVDKITFPLPSPHYNPQPPPPPSLVAHHYYFALLFYIYVYIHIYSLLLCN